MAKQAAGAEEETSVVRIIVAGYRKPYAANDFVDPEARSTDDQIARYVCASASRAPWGAPRKLVLRIMDETVNQRKEAETSKAYRAMFEWRAQAALRKFLRQLPMVVLLLVMGVFLLWLSHRVENFAWEEELVKTLGEAIRLGAWVSGWSAISLLFAQGLESLRNFVIFRNLTRVPVEFEYDKTAQTKRSLDRDFSSASV